MQRWGLLMATAATFGLALVPAAHAGTTFTVTTTTDDVSGNAASCTGNSAATTCGLRDAVAAANASPGSTIQLGAQTYDLSYGELNLKASMTIVGQGSSATEIDQQTGSGNRVLEIDPATAGSSVTVSGVEITGGDETGTVAVAAQGAGVLVDPSVSGVSMTLSGDLVTQNYVYGASGATAGTKGGAAEGGGVAVDSAGSPLLTLANTVVSINAARAGDANSSNSATPGAGGEADGGGVEFASTGTLTVTGGAISGNYAIGGRGEPANNTTGLVGGYGGNSNGGGLEAVGTLALNGAAIENDVAQSGTGGGGAGSLAADGAGGEASGGGLIAEAAATISGAEVTGDQIQIAAPGSGGGYVFGGAEGRGGGVDIGNLNGTDSSNATISASTIANNLADYEVDGDGDGGGIADAAAKFVLENSTVEGNSAQGSISGFVEGFGGGLDISGTATLADDTIAANQTSGYGGNLYVQEAELAATDTIVADGTGMTTFDNCDAGLSASIGDLPGHANNLESDGTGECKFTAVSDLHAEPQLGALSLNGGSTETMLPASTSPAIGAGGACIDPTTSARLALDQRGEPRPTGTGVCDIGAVQTQSPANTIAPAITGTATLGQTLTCATGTWTGDGTLAYTYQWLRGTTQVATGSTYVVTAADTGQSLTCTVTANSTYGGSSAASSPVTVPVPPATKTTTTSPPPTTTPSLSNFHESASKWRRSGKASKHKPPPGTTFTFNLNETAAIELTFSQPGKGRKVSGKCVAQNAKNHKKQSCTLTLGTISLAGNAGKNSVKFAGKLSSGELKPGGYTVTITAKAANGQSSKTLSLKFTIVT
jgi:hypothetical protein